MKTLTLLTALLTLCAATRGASNKLAPADGYTAADWLTDIYPGGFDVDQQTIYVWAGADEGLRVYDRWAGTAETFGAPAPYFTPTDQLTDQQSNPYSSFVRLDPTGQSLWAGFTTDGNVDDRIYQLDLATGAWTHRATLAGAADLEFAGAGPLVSGLNSADWSTPNSIWLLDVSGADQHDRLAVTGGYANGLAVDAAGDVFYATTDGRLLRFASAEVNAAIGASNLTDADATLLSALPGGGYDVALDEAGNVLVTCNGEGAQLLRWTGAAGPGENTHILSTGAGAWGNWHGPVAAIGDVTGADGSAWVSDFYYPGLTEVATVPAPAPAAMTALAAAALLRRRRRN